MFSRVFLKLFFVPLFVIAWASTTLADADVEAMLQDFAKDFENDPNFISANFGIKVGDEIFAISNSIDGDKNFVTVSKGYPETPTFYFETDLETFTKIHNGTMTAITAAGKARSSDFAPFDVKTMEGFEVGVDFLPTFLTLLNHFWLMGTPEIMPFSEEGSRVVHGANVSVLHYEPGFRSAVYFIKKGQHVNADPKDQSNPFPSLFVFIKGEGMGRIGGKDMTLKAGQAMLVPAGVPHEFWNDNDTPLEGILIMFGEGA